MYGLKVRWTSLFIFLIAFLIQNKDDNWLNSLKIEDKRNRNAMQRHHSTQINSLCNVP